MSSFRDSSSRRDSYSRSYGSRPFEGRDRRGEQPRIDSYRPASSVPRPLGIKLRPGSTSVPSSAHADARDREGRPHSSSSGRARESSEWRHLRDEDRAYADRRGSKAEDYDARATDGEKRQRTRHLDERKREVLESDLNDADTPLTHGSSEQHLTPALIVEEFKKRGHFDTVRKQLFTDFQSSPHKQVYLDELQSHLLSCLENFSTTKKQRLAAKDQRLQHSEITALIDEGRDAKEARRKLLSHMNPARESGDGDGGFFDEREGGLGYDIRARLREVINAERQRLRGGNTEEMESDDEPDEEDGSSNVTTPMVYSGATPLDREAPHTSQSRGGSVGSRTPLTVAASK